MKKFLVGACLSVVMSSSFAGVFPVDPIAVSSSCTPNPVIRFDTVPTFCVQFPQSVISCSPFKPRKGQPPAAYMQQLYKMMVAVYGSLTAACNSQARGNGSSPAACISQWNCYLQGGTSSDPAEPGLCSGTGKSCL